MIEPAPMPSGLVLFALSFGVLLAFVLVLWAVNYLKGWRPSHMSSASALVERADGTTAVHVPVRDTGTSVCAPRGTNVAAPDTDASDVGTEGWNTPRLSLRLSDTETIALLAAQRGKDGKHRYSANAIHALIGGSRADVLAQVRAIRDGAPAVYPPLTPEQAQLRSQLQLDRT